MSAFRRSVAASLSRSRAEIHLTRRIGAHRADGVEEEQRVRRIGAALPLVILSSWGLAFFEYMLQVPANRIGFTDLNVAQLRILQEVISLSVFVPFAVLYLEQPLKLDNLWAGLCLIGAVYFIFRT